MTMTLITGANKGLGHETARRLLGRGHTVYIGARDGERGKAAAAELGGRFVQIDVTDDASVQSALDLIEQDEGHLDVLVNNAGIWDGRIGTDGLTGATALREFDTNVIGVIRVTQAALPLLHKSEHAVVVNISSALGSFYATTTAERHESHAPAMITYSASKAAVSMLTVQYAKALGTDGIAVNAVAPGAVASDFTKNLDMVITRTPDDGARIAVRLATAGPDGPTGGFFNDDGTVPW